MAAKHQSAGGLAKYFADIMNRGAAGKLAALIIFMFFSLMAEVYSQENGEWRVGRFSFSDELGGFTITGVSGTGTQGDPFLIRQVFDTATSATLVIRNHGLSDTLSLSDRNVTHSAIHLRIETLNNSNLPWVGFGFELQEIKDKVSTYGDGLSFDQLGRKRTDVFSNRFADFEDQFEPGDRLVYTNGVVNNQTQVTTSFIITDFTPVNIFYLLQDPLIPAS